MSIKALNFVARNTIGAFLTSSPDTTTAEYEVVSKACDMTVERLKEEKVRGQNLLHCLPQLASIIRDVTNFMEKEAAEKDLHDSRECWNVFAMIIVHSALANFYKKNLFNQDKKND